MLFSSRHMDGEDFSKVEYESELSQESFFYIDKISVFKFEVDLLIFFIIMIIHSYTGYKSPPIFKTNDQIFKIDNEKKNESKLDFDISFTDLLPDHEFIDLSSSIILNSRQDQININVKSKTTFFFNFVEIGEGKETSSKESLSVDDLTHSTSNFSIIHSPVQNFDAVVVKLTIETNFKNVDSFLFEWSFKNTEVIHYFRSSNYLMSGLIGFMLYDFYHNLHFVQKDRITQIFCIILGIFGILFSNPISIFFNIKKLNLYDFLMESIFYGIFRIFLIYQLEMLQNQSNNSSILFLALFGLFFGIHAFVNVAASYDRFRLICESEKNIPVVLFTEKIHILFNILFIVLLLTYFIFAMIQNDKSYIFRCAFFGIVVVLLSLSTFIFQIFFVLKNIWLFSFSSKIILNSVYFTSASFSIFFLHYENKNGYIMANRNASQSNTLDVPKLADDEQMIVDQNNYEEINEDDE